MPDDASYYLSDELDRTPSPETAAMFAQMLRGLGRGAWDSNVATPVSMAAHPVQAASGVAGGVSQLFQHPLDTLKSGASSLWQGLSGGPEALGATVGGLLGPGDYAKGLKALETAGEASRGISAITHEIKGEGAHHFVESPNGTTYAQQATNGRDLTVKLASTDSEARRRGEGTDRLQTLADYAHAQGGILQSDVSVSPGAARTYEKLGERGYDVRKNPGATVNPDTGNWISDDPRAPVFTVHPAGSQ